MQYDPSGPVARGFALVTEYRQRLRLVNLETLDIAYPASCLLTQMFGSYERGRDYLASEIEYDGEERFSVAYGFDAPDWGDSEVYDGTYRERCEALTLEWKRVITEARQG